MTLKVIHSSTHPHNLPLYSSYPFWMVSKNKSVDNIIETEIRERFLSYLNPIILSMKTECVTRSVMSDFLRTHGLQPERILCPWNSPGKNTEVVSHFLLQGVLLTQGLNLGLLHCRHILYCLSNQRSPSYSQINYKKSEPSNEHKDSSTKNPDEPIGYKPWITESQLKQRSLRIEKKNNRKKRKRKFQDSERSTDKWLSLSHWFGIGVCI